MTTEFAGVCMGVIFFISGFGTDQVCFSNTLSESHEAASLTDVVYQVDWGYRSNVVLNEDNSMTKSGASAWDAGAASYNKLNSGANGWIEFALSQAGGPYGLGLSKAKLSLNFSSIVTVTNPGTFVKIAGNLASLTVRTQVNIKGENIAHTGLALIVGNSGQITVAPN